MSESVRADASNRRQLRGRRWSGMVRSWLRLLACGVRRLSSPSGASTWLTFESPGQSLPLICCGDALLLSEAEINALRLLVRGADDRAVAHALRLTLASAATLRCRLYRRLNAASPAALAERASTYGVR